VASATRLLMNWVAPQRVSRFFGKLDASRQRSACWFEQWQVSRMTLQQQL
jgi:hypothetical protein